MFSFKGPFVLYFRFVGKLFLGLFYIFYIFEGQRKAPRPRPAKRRDSFLFARRRLGIILPLPKDTFFFFLFKREESQDIPDGEKCRGFFRSCTFRALTHNCRLSGMQRHILLPQPGPRRATDLLSGTDSVMGARVPRRSNTNPAWGARFLGALNPNWVNQNPKTGSCRLSHSFFYVRCADSPT